MSRFHRIKSVRSVERTLQILDCFDLHHRILGPADVARKVNLPKSTAYRLLLTLEQFGFVARIQGAEKFALGPRLLHLGNLVRAGSHLLSQAQPVMEQLRDQFRESVHLHVREGWERVCIFSLEGHYDLRTASGVGSRVPLYVGAAARAILAFLPREQWQEVIDRGLAPVTALTITDPQRLLAELEQVRRQGYAISAGERDEGITSVAAPCLNAAGLPEGSLNLSGPSFRFTPAAVAQMSAAVRAGARLVSSRLGYAGAMAPSQADAGHHSL